MRPSYVTFIVLAWTAASACWRFPSRETEHACTSKAALLQSPSEATHSFQNISTASFSCPDDCEARILARACELGADAVIVGAAERTPHGAGAGHVRTAGDPLRPNMPAFNSRDEQGNMMAPASSSTTRRATFLRWTD